MDFDLGLLGFSKDELAKLLDPGVQEGLTDPDDVPEPPDEAITKPGDLWILGDHRLLCGDSSKPEDVDRLLGGAKIQLANTDPPYNVAVAPRTNNAWASGERRGMPRPELAEAFGGWNLQEAAEGGKPKTDRKMRARDRALKNDFVSDAEFDRLLNAWFGNIARVLGARPLLLHLGRLRELRQLPAGAEGPEALLRPGDHLGQGASRC